MFQREHTIFIIKLYYTTTVMEIVVTMVIGFSRLVYI
jgi:hypothetical protein